MRPQSIHPLGVCLLVSIDEKPVRRCALDEFGELTFAEFVSIDEKPVRRCALTSSDGANVGSSCPSMRNPSGGAPMKRARSPRSR